MDSVHYGKTTKSLRLLSKWLRAAATGALIATAAASHAGSITVNPANELGPVNHALLGNNMLGYTKTWNTSTGDWSYKNYQIDGAGVWNTGAYAPVPAMVGYAKDIGMRYARFPGGGGVHWYNWKDAVGPIADRPLHLDANGEYVPITFGLPEFLKTAQAMGADPVIEVSEYTGTPQDAADLVEYLNAPSGTNPNGGTAWAAIRDQDREALGLPPGPWNVKWFEYGNETYLGNSADSALSLSADQYVTEYKKYQTAMKSVDPNIKLGAVIEPPRYIGTWSDRVILGTGRFADFYITHSYVLSYRRNDGVPGADTLFSIALAGTDNQLASYYKKINNLVLELTGRTVPIAVTEFNGGFVQSGPVPYRHTLGDALVNADQIRQLMHDPNIIMGDYWQYANSYWGMINSSGTPDVLRPNYYPFLFYNKHFGDTLLNAQVNVGTYDSAGGYGVAPASGTHQDEVLGTTDLLGNVSSWTITPATGVEATQQNGILDLQFDNADTDYSNAQKVASVTPNTWYELTGFINSNNLTSGDAAYLTIGSTTDLIDDSAFDNDIACGGAGPWKFCPNADFGTGSATLDTSTYHSAPTSVKASLVDATNVYHIKQQKISVTPGATYVLDGYVKTDNMVVSGTTNPKHGVGLEVQDSRGAKYGNWTSTLLNGTTNGWQHISMQFTTKPANTNTGDPGTTSVTVLLRGYAGGDTYTGGPAGTINGTVWWDDVALHNEAETQTIENTNPWRYVHLDFMADGSTSNAVITARTANASVAMSGDVQLKDVRVRKFTPGNYGAVPYLSVNASKSKDGSKLYLMVVNKNMTTALSPTLNITGQNAYAVHQWTLDGTDVTSTNENGLNVTVATPEIGQVPNGSYVSFPAHSLTALEIDLDPDLVPTAMAADKKGHWVFISDTVKNQGSGPAGPFTISYYLSKDTTYDPGTDLPLLSSAGTSACVRTVNSLEPGASSSVSDLQCSAPSTVVTGQRYYVLAVADSGQQVAETNESNNVAAATTLVWW